MSIHCDTARFALAGAGYRACVEVSPHPVLTAAITATTSSELVVEVSV